MKAKRHIKIVEVLTNGLRSGEPSPERVPRVITGGLVDEGARPRVVPLVAYEGNKDLEDALAELQRTLPDPQIHEFSYKMQVDLMDRLRAYIKRTPVVSLIASRTAHVKGVDADEQQRLLDEYELKGGES